MAIKKIICCILFFSLSTSGSKHTSTQLSFYCHVHHPFTNTTTVTISPPVNPKSYGLWGGLYMIDTMLTVNPDPKSTQIGWAQGIYAEDKKGLRDPSSLDAITFSFTSSKCNGIACNGSTLSILGQNPFKREVRELAVVGGTGKFRYATGYAEARTHSSDKANGITVIGVNVSFIMIA